MFSLKLLTCLLPFLEWRFFKWNHINVVFLRSDSFWQKTSIVRGKCQRNENAYVEQAHVANRERSSSRSGKNAREKKISMRWQTFPQSGDSNKLKCFRLPVVPQFTAGIFPGSQYHSFIRWARYRNHPFTNLRMKSWYIFFQMKWIVIRDLFHSIKNWLVSSIFFSYMLFSIAPWLSDYSYEMTQWKSLKCVPLWCLFISANIVFFYHRLSLHLITDFSVESLLTWDFLIWQPREIQIPTHEMRGHDVLQTIPADRLPVEGCRLWCLDIFD